MNLIAAWHRFAGTMLQVLLHNEEARGKRGWYTLSNAWLCGGSAMRRAN